MKLRAPHVALAALSLSIGACQSAQTVPPAAAAPAATSAEGVIAAMHDRYADSWYRTLRFRQRVVHTPPQEMATRTVLASRGSTQIEGGAGQSVPPPTHFRRSG